MARRPIETGEERMRRRRSRAISVAEVIDFLEYLAPPALSVPDEPFGLQVGAPTSVVRTVVVSPMASFTALSTAASRRQAMLVTSAPLLTAPLYAVRSDDPIGGKLAYLLEHHIDLYALPVSYAAAPGGFDDSLAEALGLAATTALKPTKFEQQYKIAVYVPPEAVDAVFNAAADAGAGRIGNYSRCSFQTEGTGTFVARQGANPTVGQVGRLERVAEVRIEMLVSQRELQGVIAAVLEAHPYEEVAYDVYVVKNPGVLYGRGRIGELPLKVSLDTVLAQVRDALGVTSIRCSHRSEMSIGALAAASGMSEGLFWQANRGGAGAFVTGDATPHDLMLAESSTTVLIDVGYAASVAPGLRRLCVQLQDTFGSDGVEVVYCA